MSAKGKEISVDERKIILKLREDGESFREIGRVVNRTESSVRYVIQTFKKTGIITSKPRSGRPRILTDRETRKVVSLVKVNPRLTASQIAEDVKLQFKKTICSDTARKILKRAGYHGRVARKKPFISLKNRMKHIVFVNEHILKPISFWQWVLM